MLVCFLGIQSHCNRQLVARWLCRLLNTISFKSKPRMGFVHNDTCVSPSIEHGQFPFEARARSVRIFQAICKPYKKYPGGARNSKKVTTDMHAC